MDIACIICACDRVKKKDKTRYRVHVIDVWGIPRKIWSYQNLSHLISPDTAYQLTVDTRTFSKQGFNITYSTVKAVKTIGRYNKRDRAETAIAEQKIFSLSCRTGTCFRHNIWEKFKEFFWGYRKTPKVIANESKDYVFDRVQAILEDLVSTQGDDYSQWLSTYKEPEIEQELDLSQEDDNFWQVLDSHRPMYGIKSQYLYVNKPVENPATKIKPNKDIDVNNFPEFGIGGWVDSVCVMVALRERHVFEWYMYWLIVGYAKKSRKFPRVKMSGVWEFLKKYLTKYRRGYLVNTLIKMHDLKMIEIDSKLIAEIKKRDKNKSLGIREAETLIREYPSSCLNILSQKKYVRSREAAYNSKCIRGRGVKRIWKKNRNWKTRGWICFDEENSSKVKNPSKWVASTPTSENGKELTLPDGMDIHSVWRPYFDIHFPKTAKMDLGFAALVNSDQTHMRSFMYELCVSSVGEYPLCRTRWRMNLLLSQTSQRRLEKINKNILKHYNHMEIPSDMQDRIKPYILKDMEKLGKFKITANGRLLRQEGNSWRSKRVNWVSPKKPRHCQLHLSQSHLKAWKYGRPWYNSSKNGELVNPHFRNVPDKVVEKTQPKVYSRNKKDLLKGSFAYCAKGVIVPSTMDRDWLEFEPMISWERNTGEGVAPPFPSFDGRDFSNRPYHRKVGERSINNRYWDLSRTNFFSL